MIVQQMQASLRVFRMAELLHDARMDLLGMPTLWADLTAADRAKYRAEVEELITKYQSLDTWATQQELR